MRILALAALLAAPATAQELSLVSMAGSQEAAFAELIAAFEAEHPGVTIEYQAIPYDQFMQTLTTRVVGGEAPDMAYLLDRWANALAGQGRLMDLTGEVDEAYVEAVLPFHWSQFTQDGAQIGVPITFNIQSLVVNEDALEEAGVAIPQTFEEAWSWDDLVEVGRDLKEAGVTPFAFAHWPNSTPSRLSQYLVAEGGSVLSDDLSAPNLDNETTRELLAEIAATYEEGLVPPDNWTTPSEIWPLFLAGEVAIQVAGGNFSKSSIDQAEVPFEWTYSIMPTTLGTANPMVVFEDTEHPEIALDFVRYMTTPEAMLIFAEHTAYLPARQDIPEAELEAAFGEDAGKMKLLMEEQTKGITPVILGEMSSPAWSEIDMFLRGKLEELSLGLIDAEAFVSESEPEIERILAQYE